MLFLFFPKLCTILGSFVEIYVERNYYRSTDYLEGRLPTVCKRSRNSEYEKVLSRAGNGELLIFFLSFHSHTRHGSRDAYGKAYYFSYVYVVFIKVTLPRCAFTVILPFYAFGLVSTVAVARRVIGNRKIQFTEAGYPAGVQEFRSAIHQKR